MKVGLFWLTLLGTSHTNIIFVTGINLLTDDSQTESVTTTDLAQANAEFGALAGLAAKAAGGAAGGGAGAAGDPGEKAK